MPTTSPLDAIAELAKRVTALEENATSNAKPEKESCTRKRPLAFTEAQRAVLRFAIEELRSEVREREGEAGTWFSYRDWQAKATEVMPKVADLQKDAEFGEQCRTAFISMNSGQPLVLPWAGPWNNRLAYFAAELYGLKVQWSHD